VFFPVVSFFEVVKIFAVLFSEFIPTSCAANDRSSSPGSSYFFKVFLTLSNSTLMDSLKFERNWLCRELNLASKSFSSSFFCLAFVSYLISFSFHFHHLPKESFVFNF